MKNIDTIEIYSKVIKPLNPNYLGKKPTKKETILFNERLIALSIGLIIGTDLVGNNINKLAKQIKNLSITNKEDKK